MRWPVDHLVKHRVEQVGDSSLHFSAAYGVLIVVRNLYHAHSSPFRSCEDTTSDDYGAASIVDNYCASTMEFRISMKQSSPRRSDFIAVPVV